MNAPEGSLYRPLVLSLALGLVAAGALLAIQMISSVVGPFRIAELGERDPRAVVGLWRPIDTAAGSAVRSLFGHELVESGRAIREVTGLGTLDPERVGALVLTEPRALTREDIGSLEAYLDAGGGVVLLGSVAVRDPDGTWRGYERMQQLLDAKVVEIDPAAAAYAAVRRGPLSSVLAPRQRIAIAFEPGTPGVVDPDAELRWVGAGAAASGPAAAIRRTRGKGRLVWLSASPERALPGELERRRAREILEAAVAWVSRTPSVEILAWPDGAPFAGTLEASDLADAASAEAAWRRELDAARLDAGVAALGMPHDRAARAALEPALSRTLQAAKREAVWIATRKELSLWMRSRAVLDASVRRAGPRRLVVEITNRATDDLDGVVLRVHLNEPILSARATGTKLFTAAPAVALSSDRESADLALPRLEGRSSAAYNLDTEPVRVDGGNAG